MSDLKCGEKFVRARIGWRRPDLRAETKKIIVVCASTGKEVENVFVKTLNNEFGEIVFEAVSGAGEYFAYYLPYKFRARPADARYANLNDYLKPEYKKFHVHNISACIQQINPRKVKHFVENLYQNLQTNFSLLTYSKKN